MSFFEIKNHLINTENVLSIKHLEDDMGSIEVCICFVDGSKRTYVLDDVELAALLEALRRSDRK